MQVVLCGVVIVLLGTLSGCRLLGYHTVGGESYRIRGHTAATLGSWGMKDKQGLHSFECMGTPDGVKDLETEVLSEFAGVEVVDAKGKARAPIAQVASGKIAAHYSKANAHHRVVRRIDKERLLNFYRSDTDLLNRFRKADVAKRPFCVVTAIVYEIEGATYTNSGIQISGGVNPIADLASGADALTRAIQRALPAPQVETSDSTYLVAQQLDRDTATALDYEAHKLQRASAALAGNAENVAQRAQVLAGAAQSASNTSDLSAVLAEANALKQLLNDPLARTSDRTDTSTAEPLIEATFSYGKETLVVQLRGRIVGYQISHLCWDEHGNLVGLKTDRRMTNDPLPSNWLTRGSNVANE
jgi:hypothetical protein